MLLNSGLKKMACDYRQAVLFLTYVLQAICLPGYIFIIGRQDWKKLPLTFCLPAGSFILNCSALQAICLPASDVKVEAEVMCQM